MHTTRRHHLLAALTLLALLATGLSSQPVSAAARTEAAVAAYLRTNPGGVPIGGRDIAYSDGTFIVTVSRGPATKALAAADCPSGWYCFYDGPAYTYPRGRLSSCGWQDLGAWGWRNRIESAHYNMSSGTVAYLNENGSADTVLFTTSASNRYLANAGTSSNKADYVSRSGC